MLDYLKRPLLVLSGMLLAALPAKATEAKITAIVGQARIVKVPAGAQTLVIGNPTIASVTLIKKNSTMVLTPKALGETNFIALDSEGNPVAESAIHVVAGRGKLSN